MSHVPTLEICSHGTQAILPDSPFDPIPSASYLNCFLSLCQGFSLQVVVTSLFLLYKMRTLFQQVFPTLQKAALTQWLFRLTTTMGTSMLHRDIYLITKVR